jgi:hypothetical protein
MEAKVITEIRAQFIVKSLNEGLNFEQAVEKSFNQINDFLCSLIDNNDFNKQVFTLVKDIK